VNRMSKRNFMTMTYLAVVMMPRNAACNDPSHQVNTSFVQRFVIHTGSAAVRMQSSRRLVSGDAPFVIRLN